MIIQKKWLLIILCLGMILSLIVPVFANPLPRTRSASLFFENNGHPFNESINYSMECYGHFQYPTDLHKYLRNKTSDDPDPPQEIFFLAGTCPTYGCFVSITTRSPPDTYWEPEHSEICKLNGTVSGKSFAIWNVTGASGIHCSNRSDQWNKAIPLGGATHYYNFTTEYSACRERLAARGKQCQDYLVNSSYQTILSPMTHGQCIQEYNHLEQVCDSNLQEINVSEINFAEKICSFRFAIPPNTHTSETHSGPEDHPDISQSPVEFLYCSILHFLGRTC